MRCISVGRMGKLEGTWRRHEAALIKSFTLEMCERVCPELAQEI
jgi:hypothetical protein